LVAGSSGWFEHAALAHALAGEVDPVGIVNDAVDKRRTGGIRGRRLRINPRLRV
jgi:hypothetical protein